MTLPLRCTVFPELPCTSSVPESKTKKLTFINFPTPGPGYLASMISAMVPESKMDLFTRNKGLLSDSDQQLLSRTSIAIAGAGGDGGLLAERLVRLGIGKITLADPESFEPANINRQFASNIYSLGRNKAESVANELRLINPEADILVFDEGITAENVAEFVHGADIIIDEIEYSLPYLSVLLHREARAQDKHVFMGANIGWGASVFCFAPTGTSFEEHFEYDEAEGAINPLKYLKEVPGYFSDEMQEAILTGVMPMPAISPSVSLVAAMLTTEVVLFITGRRPPRIVPDFLFVDLYDRIFQ